MTSPRTPRQLLGWTVPEHIEIGAFGEDQVQLRCKLGDHEVDERAVLKTFETDNRIGAFLKTHAHGETVEYRSLSEVLPETPEPPNPYQLGAAFIAHRSGQDEQGNNLVSPVGPFPTRFAAWTWLDSQRTVGEGEQNVAPLYPPVPASESVPAVPVSSTGGKETGEAAEGAERSAKAAGRGVWLSPDGVHLAIETDGGELDELERDVDAGWLSKGTFDVVPSHWVRLVALPDSETDVQWSVREQGDERFYYHPTTDEEDAREEAACREGNALGKRQVWYGPWIEVTS